MKERSFFTFTNYSRVLFIVMNVVFVLIGIVLMIFGIILITMGIKHNSNVIAGSQLISGAVLLVAAGIFTYIVAIDGLVEAIFMWRPVLIIYVWIILFLIIAEIAAGILGFAYRDSVTKDVEQRMTNSFNQYNEDSHNDEDYQNIAYMQEAYQCCGVNGSEDWLKTHPEIFTSNGLMPPLECICEIGEDHCMTVRLNISAGELPGLVVDQEAMYNAWDRGCFELVEKELDYIANIALWIGISGITVGILEIASIMAALYLCVCSWKRKESLAT